MMHAHGNRSQPLFYLREARSQRGISRRQLARETGVSRATLDELENLHRGAYKSTVQKLADALGCHPWELTGINPWILSTKERQALNRLLESEQQQTFFDDEDEMDRN
jgi:transcriptional regulator with XRE-family HTH domain